MKVIRAQEMGMCFGVRDAIAATRNLQTPETVTIYGELVHNEEVSRELAARRFQIRSERDRAIDPPTTPTVLITAHGVSDVERAQLQAAGRQLVDTTCPLVRYAHQAALDLQSAGCRVIVIGKPDHVEVQGIVGDLSDPIIVASSDEVDTYPSGLLGVISQTTTEPAVYRQILERIRLLNPQATVRTTDTICGPTRNRQHALEELLDQVEALVVVGGRHSNNTKALARAAEKRGIPAHHVANAAELDLDRLAQYGVVGLSAGTSTLDGTIEEVYRALTAVAAVADASLERSSVTCR